MSPLPLAKVPWFQTLFARHAQSRIADMFYAVRAHGIEQARALASESALLIVSNHTSWWDPLLVLYLSHRVLGTDGYALMDAKNLRALPFFQALGAIGVELDNPHDGARALRHIARLLDRPGRLVWVFPQGRERPCTERPLGFRGGSAQVARVARHAHVVPAGIRYEFGACEKPIVYVSFGPPIAVSGTITQTRIAQEEAVVAELKRIEQGICTGDQTNFTTLLASRQSWRSRAATELLTWLFRRLIGSRTKPTLPEISAHRDSSQ